MITSDQATEAAKRIIKDKGVTGLLAPLDPVLLKASDQPEGSTIKNGRWLVSFPMNIPDNIVQTPDSVLVSVECSDGYAEVVPGL